MPIIPDRDVKFPYKRYRYYLQAFLAKAVVSQWLHRCPTVGVFVYNTIRRRFESWHVSFLSVWKCDKGFVHFLHLVAKSPSAFPKNGSILDKAN